jgi:DNA-binding response OmpR family regulator
MSSETILVIDDEHTLLRLSQILLQKKGFTVKTALSVREAENYLSGGGTADIIVLDLMMPELNGFDFLKWKKDQAPEIKEVPVIVNTAKNLSPDEKSFLEENSLRIMTKGVQFTDMLVREVVDALKSIKGK